MKDRPSTINRMTDSVILMVSSLAVREVFSLSLIKVNMLAARLANMSTSRVRMMIFMSIRCCFLSNGLKVAEMSKRHFEKETLSCLVSFRTVL